MPENCLQPAKSARAGGLRRRGMVGGARGAGRGLAGRPAGRGLARAEAGGARAGRRAGGEPQLPQWTEAGPRDNASGGPSCRCRPLPRALFHQLASSWINLL